METTEKEPEEVCPVQKLLCCASGCPIVGAWKRGKELVSFVVGSLCVKRRRTNGYAAGIDAVDRRYY